MITIQRHENLDNWIEVRFHGKLLEQFTSQVKAYQFARHQAQKTRTKIWNLDKGLIGERKDLK